MKPWLIIFSLIPFLTFAQVTQRDQTYMTAHHTATTLPPIDANVQLYYSCDEGSGTSVADSSGNGRNGILTTDRLWITP